MSLYFLHLPKTAGTSLDILFKVQYSKKDLHPWDNIKFRELQDKYEKRELKPQPFKVLKGHYTYGIHDYFSGTDDYKYLTILRDPVARVKSHIRQYLRMPNSYIYKEYQKDKNLYKLISENQNYGFSNLQTCWIAGVNRAIPSEMESVYDKAIKNLSKDFIYVGIVEMFDESLFQIYKRTQWKYKPYYSSLNKSSSKEVDDIQFDADTIKLIEDLNYYDIKLYNEYKKIVQEDHAKQDLKAYNNYLTRLKYFQKFHACYLQFKNLI